MTLQRRNELIAQIQKLAAVGWWSKHEKDQIAELFESLVIELYEATNRKK